MVEIVDGDTLYVLSVREGCENEECCNAHMHPILVFGNKDDAIKEGKLRAEDWKSSGHFEFDVAHLRFRV